MARVDMNKTCGTCTFCHDHYCIKTKLMVRATQYACKGFMTEDEWRAEREAREGS